MEDSSVSISLLTVLVSGSLAREDKKVSPPCVVSEYPLVDPDPSVVELLLSTVVVLLGSSSSVVDSSFGVVTSTVIVVIEGVTSVVTSFSNSDVVVSLSLVELVSSPFVVL